MSPYQEKLKDPRWQKKRLEIFDRDGWACMKCGHKDKPLNIHHLCYLPHTEPWDYNNELLKSLCDDCHKKSMNNSKLNDVYSTYFLAKAFLTIQKGQIEEKLKGGYDKHLSLALDRIIIILEENHRLWNFLL